jgi:hypothetical protein
MDQYANIYWLDERNAGRDHRTQGGGGGSPAPWRPGTPAVPPPAAAVPPPAQSYYPQPYPAQPYPAQPYYPAQPFYPGRPAWYPPATFFGGLTLGQIIEMVAQALAALQSLPGSPVATGEVTKDVGNLVLYQSAIAQHAKRDEQLRTLGSLIGKLVK